MLLLESLPNAVQPPGSRQTLTSASGTALSLPFSRDMLGCERNGEHEVIRGGVLSGPYTRWRGRVLRVGWRRAADGSRVRHPHSLENTMEAQPKCKNDLAASLLGATTRPARTQCIEVIRAVVLEDSSIFAAWTRSAHRGRRRAPAWPAGRRGPRAAGGRTVTLLTPPLSSLLEHLRKGRGRVRQNAGGLAGRRGPSPAGRMRQPPSRGPPRVVHTLAARPLPVCWVPYTARTRVLGPCIMSPNYCSVRAA